ncbi:hypothetical protein P7C71_g5621, partial [Lecanoromycetidae sp. Uapishka_2]
MISRFPQFVLAAAVAFTLFSLSVLFSSESVGQSIRTSGSKSPASHKTHGNETHDNETQDASASSSFEKVFVLNLPERTDKLDLFALASSVTGFAFNVIKGVKGAEINNKSLPTLNGAPTSDNPDKEGIIGCWRAHMDAAQAIIRDRLSTVLILEDDADWDTHLKDQLELFAQGSQFVTGTPRGKTPHSPYGDDWDLLWLGHCGTGISDESERRFVIENDFTVPPTEGRLNYAGVPDLEKDGYDKRTRIVFPANWGVCMYAYALSYHGAQKLLRSQSTLQSLQPIDLAIGGMCGDEFKCIGVFPQLFDTHKAAGRVGRDSDMRTPSEGEHRDKSFTANIVHSTKLNLDLLLKDASAKPERQWPEDSKVVGPPRTKLIGQEVGQATGSDRWKSSKTYHNE